MRSLRWDFIIIFQYGCPNDIVKENKRNVFSFFLKVYHLSGIAFCSAYNLSTEEKVQKSLTIIKVYRFLTNFDLPIIPLLCILFEDNIIIII